ncbi:1-phosphofructokinase family hexose kinase [Actinophytocola gossypii]|uniref:Hexose kinase n=1 Tax=Actinophytocola gossypii TaxID=2812003 RepID=A0ABT2J6F1_9PSEU|nr:hexose kinase [Actinophytocola gossypii]MCT2583351.1 hexose kinase [Actinophytocola gossypii]
MILTVTLNAALDVTYHVPALVPGESHRVSEVAVRAGGKGVNVARVLRALGHNALVTGFAGGTEIQADLAAAGIPESLVALDAPVRRTVTVVADGDATVLNEPGPRVSISDWSRLVGDFHQLAERADVVVLSGSLPPGLPSDAYAQLIRTTTTPVILDTSGQALLDGVPAGPRLVKPNAEELAAVTGHDDPRAGAEWLRARGVGAVLASFGEDGLLAVTADGVWRARPEPMRGNPTGAGDACVAALAAGIAAGAGWPELLADAVALSAAAVACPLAGDVDLDIYRRLAPDIEVEELPC